MRSRSTRQDNGQKTELIPAGDRKNKKIAVLTYDVPHQKTYDVLTLLKAAGYKNVIAYGIEMHYKKKFKPLIEHRPELNIKMKPWELCRNLGYDYKKVTYQEIDLDDKSIFLVAGAGILPKEFVFKYKIINSHPGYIPDCRGLDALKWAIYEGKPIGVTTHLLGDETDAGEIIERKIIPVYANDTFYRLCERVYRNEIKMLVDAIEGLEEEHEYISGGNRVIHKRMPHECEKELLEKFEQIKNRI